MSLKLKIYLNFRLNDLVFARSKHDHNLMWPGKIILKEKSPDTFVVFLYAIEEIVKVNRYDLYPYKEETKERFINKNSLLHPKFTDAIEQIELIMIEAEMLNTLPHVIAAKLKLDCEHQYSDDDIHNDDSEDEGGGGGGGGGDGGGGSSSSSTSNSNSGSNNAGGAAVAVEAEAVQNGGDNADAGAPANLQFSPKIPKKHCSAIDCWRNQARHVSEEYDDITDIPMAVDRLYKVFDVDGNLKATQPMSVISRPAFLRHFRTRYIKSTPDETVVSSTTIDRPVLRSHCNRVFSRGGGPSEAKAAKYMFGSNPDDIEMYTTPIAPPMPCTLSEHNFYNNFKLKKFMYNEDGKRRYVRRKIIQRPTTVLSFFEGEYEMYLHRQIKPLKVDDDALRKFNEELVNANYTVENVATTADSDELIRLFKIFEYLPVTNFLMRKYPLFVKLIKELLNYVGDLESDIALYDVPMYQWKAVQVKLHALKMYRVIMRLHNFSDIEKFGEHFDELVEFHRLKTKHLTSVEYDRLIDDPVEVDDEQILTIELVEADNGK